MSQIKVDSIIPRGGLPGGATGGGIIQMVQAVKTDTASTNSPAETAFVDTGLSVTITPQSTSSKILVLWNIFIGSAADNVTMLKLQRGTTDILLGDASSTRIRVTQAQGSRYNDDPWQSDIQAGQYIDSPSTTSATTYKFVWCSNGDTYSYINRCGRDQTNTNDEDVRATSSMTAMEVSG
tara:strand:+ start:133 stop:672 length:540 start_codon:yes stop_codon:yes gene_type:complete